MKKETLYETFGAMDDQFIEEARMPIPKSRPGWIRWGALAACVALMVTAATALLPRVFPDPGGTEPEGEIGFGQSYLYEIDAGPFCSYESGKVIPEDKIGDKIGDVTVTAGWWDHSQMAWISREKTSTGETPIHFSIIGVVKQAKHWQ